MVEWVVWSIQSEPVSDGKVILFDDEMPRPIRAWPPPRASTPTACLFTLLSWALISGYSLLSVIVTSHWMSTSCSGQHSHSLIPPELAWVSSFL